MMKTQYLVALILTSRLMHLVATLLRIILNLRSCVALVLKAANSLIEPTHTWDFFSLIKALKKLCCLMEHTSAYVTRQWCKRYLKRVNALTHLLIEVYHIMAEYDSSFPT